MDRIEALIELKEKLEGVDKFINDLSPKAPINCIDPKVVKFQDLGYATESAIDWLKREIINES